MRQETTTRTLEGPVTIIYNKLNPKSCNQTYTFDNHEQALTHLLGRDVCLKSISRPSSDDDKGVEK